MKVGQRIIEVNGQSLLGVTHQEAVAALRNAGDSIHIIVCEGFDAERPQEEEEQEREEEDGEESMQEKVRRKWDC